MLTPNPQRAPLSEEQQAERASGILDRIKSGQTAKEIAQAVRCSLTEVYRVSKMASVPFKRSHTPEEAQREVAEFYKDHTLNETRAKYGLSAPTIIKYAKLFLDHSSKQPGRKQPGEVSIPPGDILRMCSLRIVREKISSQRVEYWLASTNSENGKRMAIKYNPDVLALRKDPTTWIKANAATINEELS